MTELNPGIEAVRKLARIGYHVTVSGNTIKGLYMGQDKPAPEQVLPLVSVMKVHKEAVRRYLAHAQGSVSNQPERILTCNECPWYRENPWTHYPDLPAWCGYHFDHLAADNPACIGYRKGEIPAPT